VSLSAKPVQVVIARGGLARCIPRRSPLDDILGRELIDDSSRFGVQYLHNKPLRGGIAYNAEARTGAVTK